MKIYNCIHIVDCVFVYANYLIVFTNSTVLFSYLTLYITVFSTQLICSYLTVK